MQNLGLFRYLQPSFFSGLLDDPVLHINVRPTGRGILLDCGQIHHLAKRVLRSIDAVFISHAHMDHLIGFDHLLRHIHVAPRTFDLFGPPGIAQRIGHKLSGYDWNLTEETWCTIEVFEVQPQQIEHFEFAGRSGFRCQHRQTVQRRDPVIYQSRYLSVRAEICDHKIPVLIFRVTEREAFLLDRERIEAERLHPGPWVKELERRFHAKSWGNEPFLVWKKTETGYSEEPVEDIEHFYRRICRKRPPASVGYISDLGMTDENLKKIHGLLHGVSLLVAECTFLGVDEEKARLSAHLCSNDLNRISQQLKPDFLLPMHLSKSYIIEPQSLYRQLALPSGTQLLKLPGYLTPRPLLPNELPPLLPKCGQ